jgi:hypothetical protein
MLTGDTARITPPPTDGNASNIGDLVQLGLDHTAHANITGKGLQSLQDDPSVQSAQNTIVALIKNKPGYGEQAFTIPDGNKLLAKTFTANGPSGNWKQAAITGNQAFWMVHSATLYATNTKVSEDGTISTTWHIRDKFDFIPGTDHTEEYNKWASRVHHIYNDILGAEESYPTDAKWHQTILPENVVHSH